ncbi:MAG: serine/threonine protein kinase [Planctomycetes bacterium]|nr:serine/threonine protein kinase [Planctomycetota bacterium]
MTDHDFPSGPKPPASIAARLKQRFGADVDPEIELVKEPEARGDRSTSSRSAPASTVLDRLGERGSMATRYKLRGEIARGGMGAILEVFDEDLRRRLAMKVILDRESGAAGADSASVDPSTLARFLEEAQVTGQLDHPGIVPVHELGLDAEGRVYFTMRLVHGRDLEAIFTDVAREKDGWTVPRALGVLLKACEAMAYAHDRGVVHRDLKPANVMVGRFGEVYVMDWGLARVRGHVDRHAARPRPESSTPHDGGAPGIETDRHASSSDRRDDALHTRDGDVVGTPSYMAPEQARGERDAIDERTDVYAVGAMLYRLLTGLAPYTSRTERVGGAAILKRVVAGPPPTIEELAPDTPAELAAICAKAMERDRERRYANVLALSEDLRAFLEGRVVRAFETGAVAEARKWVRRNRPLAAAMGAAVCALVLGLGASLVFAEEARDNAALAGRRLVTSEENARLAAANAEEAARQARIAREANEFLNDDLFAAIAPENKGVDVTVREVLDEASKRLDGRFASEPAIESALRMTLGTSYSKLGRHEEAREHYERALALRKAAEGLDSEDAMDSALGLAGALSELDRRAEAIALYRSTLGIARERIGPEHRATATAAGDLGIVLMHAGEYDEARELMLEALRVDEARLGREHQDTLAVENNLALLDGKQGRYADAIARLRSVHERRSVGLGERHPDTLEAANNLASALADAGELAESEALARESLEELTDVLGVDHPRVATAKGNLGLFLFRLGRAGEAEGLFEEALDATREHFGDDHPLTLTARHNRASAITDPARIEEQLAEHETVLAARRRVLGEEHIDTLESMDAVAGALRSLGRYTEAEKLFRELLPRKEQVLGADHPVTIITRENLAGVLFEAGNPAGSEPIVRAVLESRRRVLGVDQMDTARTEFNLALVLKAEKKNDEALEFALLAAEHSRKALGSVHPQTVQCLRTLGDLRMKSGANADALAAYREALDAHGKLGPENELTGYLLHQIAYVLQDAKDFAAALPVIEEAVALRERVVGPDAVGTRASLFVHARVLLRLERYAEAETKALDYLERTQRTGPAGSDDEKRGREQLVELYTNWGKLDEAAKWR